MNMIALIERDLGKKAEINFLPIQPGNVPESFADIKKSVEMLDFNLTTNIDTGIKRFIEWYNNHYKISSETIRI